MGSPKAGPVSYQRVGCSGCVGRRASVSHVARDVWWWLIAAHKAPHQQLCARCVKRNGLRSSKRCRHQTDQLHGARMRLKGSRREKSLGPLFKTAILTRQGSLDIRSKLQVPRTTASSLIHLSPIPLSPCDDDSVRATPSAHTHMKSEQSLGSQSSGSITSSREDGMRCRWRFPGLER